MSKGNMFLGMARGKVGDVVFGRRLGQQTTRAYVSRVNDAATRSQVAQRSKLGNVVSSYRAYRTLLQRAFESKNPGVTDYNRFLGENLATSQVYLTAEAVAASACVVAPYIVSKGSLPAIQVVEQSNGSFVSDIAVPAGFTIDATTTVAALTEAILGANADWIEGDQFTAVHAEQYTASQGGYPMASVRLYDVVLSSTDPTLLRTLMPANVLDVVNGFLGFTNPAFTGAVTGIHSRRESSGALKVSSARMLLTQSNSIYAQYSGEVAQSVAVETRGYNQGAYLDPGSEHGTSGGSITPGVVLSGVTTGGSSWPGASQLSLGTTLVVGGSNLDSLDNTGIVSTWSGGTFTLAEGTPVSGGRSYAVPTENQGQDMRAIFLNGSILASFEEGGGWTPDPNA